jgi:glycosyltransferase involved in cell wall biosynthesis
VTGLSRIPDVANEPTRVAGESYPLCILQSLQVGTPVIASDAGEIRGMLVKEGGLQGGLVIDVVRDTPQFIDNLAEAMERTLDAELRKQLATDAAELGRDYDMGKLVETYGRLYDQLIEGDGYGMRQPAPPLVKPGKRATA